MKYCLKTLNNYVHWEEFESENFEDAIEKAKRRLRGVAYRKAVLSETGGAKFYAEDLFHNTVAGPYKNLNGVDIEDFLEYESFFRAKGFKKIAKEDFKEEYKRTIYYRMLGIFFYLVGDTHELKYHQFNIPNEF